MTRGKIFGARPRTSVFAVFAAAILFAWVDAGMAQELTPRAYWPAPRGTNLLVFGYQYSSGDVVTDPTLPVTGVDSQMNYLQATYLNTFSIFGRTANFQINQPYAWGTTKGEVEGRFRRRDISDFSDPRIVLSINLKGAPSMDREGFQELRANPRTIVGASLLIQPPTGGYDVDRLLNAGTNRWSTKLSIGAIWPIRPKWLFEAEIGTWFFSDNDDFLEFRRKQDPITSAQLHLVHRVRPGLWASLDYTYYYGGETTVGDEFRNDLQRNSRIGGTIVFPFKQRHAIRGNYSTGIATRSGGDYDIYSISYIYAF